MYHISFKAKKFRYLDGRILHMYEAQYLHEWEVNSDSCGSEHKQLYTMDGWKATHYTNKENDK
jgi:hypothetical protein